MDEGDILHFLIKDESGNFVINLMGSGSTTIAEAISNSTVKDFDGNYYGTVIIGTQEWTTENLKVLHYLDGTVIPNITDNATWAADVTGAYCWYNNDITNEIVYGALYSAHAVQNAHGLGITGWRIPTNADFLALRTYLGGATVAGGKLKEIGTSHWTSPNTGATNEIGFLGRPGGYRGTGGTFALLKDRSLMWASDWLGFPDSPYEALLYYDSTTFSTGSVALGHPEYGMSIRLVRDI